MTARARKAAPLLRHQVPLASNVYNRAVTFLYGDRAAINARLKRDTPRGERFVPLASSCIGHWRVIERNGYEADYICLVRGKGARVEMAVLAHEALHHTAHALYRAGMPLTNDSEEAYCYYLGWIVAQCLSAIDAAKER